MIHINIWLLKFLIIFIVFQACQSQPCEKLPIVFSNYKEATSLIENANYKLKDEVNTDKSSWIRSAKFYSCDGAIGFFILQTDKKTYYHQDMSLEVWEGFKNAESFGTYYNSFVKNKYTLNVSDKPCDRQCTAIAKSSGNRCKNQSWDDCEVMKCHTHCK